MNEVGFLYYYEGDALAECLKRNQKSAQTKKHRNIRTL